MTATARDPHTVTLSWSPDQNSGRVSTHMHRVPVHAIIGLLRAGETVEAVADEYLLPRATVHLLRLLADDLATDSAGEVS